MAPCPQGRGRTRPGIDASAILNSPQSSSSRKPPCTGLRAYPSKPPKVPAEGPLSWRRSRNRAFMAAITLHHYLRKVGASQDRVPARVGSGQLDARFNREQTADERSRKIAKQVRVKRCGKSAPAREATCVAWGHHSKQDHAVGMSCPFVCCSQQTTHG